MLCDICPRNCKANRSEQKGFCGSFDTIKVARYSLHMWEEPCLSGDRGSGTVFFTGCNLKCRYCQNSDISFEAEKGRELSVLELHDIFLRLIDKGAHNINLVTPSHYVLKIAEALSIEKLPVPVVYNSGGYESVKSLKLLEGLVDIYLPDFKYAERDLAKKLSYCEDYPEVALAALKEMRRQQPIDKFGENGIMEKGMIIRHLILPLHTKNSIKCLDIIKENFGNTLVSLMSQYTPKVHFEDMTELNRPITKREKLKVESYMLSLGLDGFTQSGKAATESFIPDFDVFDAT